MISATVLTSAASAAAAAQELNEDTVSPGLLGLGVVAALGVATWLLVRSMNRHLRKINFDDGKARKAGQTSGKPASNPAEGAETDPPPTRAG